MKSDTESTTKDLLDRVHQLVVEEAHLLGQEVQDALDRSGLQRLRHISGELDRLEAVLAPRQALHVRR